MIRVLVADDQAAVRDGFAALLDAQLTMGVVGGGGGGGGGGGAGAWHSDTKP
jgi:DNA-binding NarL/FixJ family response regulator